MKDEFIINGLFYKRNDLLCRKYLNIKRKQFENDTPDLMVVMMNPGSSRPEDGNDDNTTASKAVPDDTQCQIMKVMNNCDFNYARVLNLSDLRESKSKNFYSKLSKIKDISHSIFSDERISDFNDLFIQNIPVIFAWGVDKKLKPLAIKAVERINESNPIGLLKENTEVSYYHPLPQNCYDQEKWFQEISKMLKT